MTQRTALLSRRQGIVEAGIQSIVQKDGTISSSHFGFGAPRALRVLSAPSKFSDLAVATSVHAVSGIDFGDRKIGHDIEAMQQVTGKGLEVLDFADLVDFRDHAVQNRFNFLIGVLREKRPLIFEPDLVSEEFFAVKIGNSLFECLPDAIALNSPRACFFRSSFTA